ncbi:MAG: hypothetical protein, partial [Olavius algarvensis Gamma 1 endosymbiont]
CRQCSPGTAWSASCMLNLRGTETNNRSKIRYSGIIQPFFLNQVQH